MKKILGLIAFLLCVNVFSVQAENKVFSAGETIIYDIKKLGLKVGEASLVFNGEEQIKDRPAFLITLTVKAIKFFDEEKIYVDLLDFYPMIVQRNVNIFGKKEQITEDYISEIGSVKITKNYQGKITEQIIKKENYRLDNIYSFIYRYRKNGKFQINDVLEMFLPTKNVNIKLVAIKKIKAANQEFMAYYMESNPKQYRIWFDQSEQKIPLRIDGAVGLKATTLIMKEYRK